MLTRIKLNKIFAILFILLICIIYWRKLIFTDMVLFWEIMYRFSYPFIAFYAKSIRNFSIPLWNPYSYSGTPFLASIQPGVLYPLNIVFALFNFRIALMVLVVIHTFLAGMFTYFLLRDHFKTDQYGAVLGSIIYMFNGFFVYHLEFIASFFSYVWLPVIFLFFCRSFELNFKYIFLASIFLTIQFFAGFPQFSMFTVFIIFVYMIWNVIFNIERKRVVNWFVSFLMIMFLFLLMSSVQLLPTLELIPLSERKIGLAYQGTVGYYSLPLKKIIEYTFIPLWNRILNNLGQDAQTTGFYFGMLFPVLFWLFLKNNSKKIISYVLVLSVAGYLLSLGKNLPAHKLLYDILPSLRYFRFPVQHMYLVVFAFTIAAGLGITRVSNKKIKLLLILVCYVDLMIFGEHCYNLMHKNFFNEKKQNIEFLKRDMSLFRIIHNPYTVSKLEGYFPKTYRDWVEYEDSLVPNFSMVHSIFDAYGFAVLRILQYDLLLKKILSQGSDSGLINLLNIKYLISDRAIEGKKWKLAKQGEYRIYENKEVLPRTFFIPDEKKEFSISLETLSGIRYWEPVQVTEYGNNLVRLQSDTESNGWIFLSDVYYPGWYCYVDGSNEKINEVNNLFRAIYIRKGRHNIKFVFNPLSFRIGLMISLITFVLSLAYLLKMETNQNT